jgi:hypothetical protein
MATEDTCTVVSTLRYVTLSTQFYSVGIILRLRISGIISQFPQYLHVFNRDEFIPVALYGVDQLYFPANLGFSIY